jgi:hypothetical protein
MANVLGLALRITGDASGLRLDPAQRALQRLGDEADKVGKIFDQFTGESTAAAQAQERFQQEADGLLRTLRDGGSATEFARNFERIAAAARDEAAALQEAARITESTRTNFERFQQRARELAVQLEAGRITQETYNRAVEQSARGLTDSERAAAGLATRTREIASAGGTASLQFNELSGVFSILPGPLGNIAGRISGITSASQGLSRVFAGGLSQGITSIAGSITSLINPFTLAVGAVVGLGAAATSVTRGLLSLEDRVERLGNQAFQLGVSFDFVQVLEESARRSGTSVDALRSATTRLQQQLVEAARGSATATAAIEGLGVSVQEIQTADASQQFRLIARAIADIEDPAERTAAATRLFGEAGVQLLPFFRNLSGAANDLERLGNAITDRERAQIDEFGRSLDALSVSAQGLGNAILAPFAGLGDGISRAAAEFTAGITSLVDPVLRTLEPVFTNLGRIIEVIGVSFGNLGRVIGAVFAPVADTVQQIGDALAPVNDAIVDLTRFIGDAAVSTVEFLQQFSPFAAIGAVVERITPLFDRFSGVFDNVGSTVSRVARIISTAFTRIQELTQQVFGRLLRIVTQVVSGFLEFSGLGQVLTAFANTAARAFDTLLDNIRGVIDRVGGFIESIVSFAEDWLGIVDTIEEPIQPELDAGQLAVELSDELAKAQESVAQFGNAGVEAFLEYKAQLDEIALLVAEGEYDGEAQARAIEQATKAFEDQAKTLAEQAQQEIEQLNEANTIELQIETAGLQAVEALKASIAEVIDESSALGEAGFDAALQYQDALGELQRQFEQGVVNETVLAREAKAAREEYDAQVAAIQASVKAQEELIANDRERIASLLQVNDAAQRITDDIASVDREIARVQDELARAAGELDAASAESAQRRLTELEGLQARLANDLQATAQGFDQGFAAAFDSVGQRFNGLAEQAAQFGEAGVAAAARLQEGIALAQQQAEDGILNREAFDAEVARREALFAQEIEQVQAVANERQRINELVDQRFLLARFGGDQQRLDAARNLAALEAEVGRVQADVQAARAAGDQAAANAGIARLGQLDQVAAQERDIASGRQQLEETLAEQRDQYLQQLQQQQEQAQQEQEKFLEEQRKAIEAEQQRQAERIRELNTLGSGVIEGNDIRTAEGAALFLQLAANRQDPALIEARLQTRRLTEIRQEVRALVEGLTGLPVLNIAGGAG